MQDGLQGHPPYWYGVTLVSTIVILQEHFLTQSEVSNLDAVILVHETVPGGKVAVDKLPVGEVDHAGEDLLGHAELLSVGDLDVSEDVAPVRAPDHVVARAVMTEVVSQVSSGHELEQETHRLPQGTHSPQLHYVGMVEL